jgi:Uma2 family endonuclease
MAVALKKKYLSWPSPRGPGPLSKPHLPTMYDLPSEDPEEPGLPDDFHSFQPQLLRETFCPPTYPVEHVYVAADLNLYYDEHHQEWHKRPDWFAVLGVPRSSTVEDLRLSYLIWQEEIAPFVVIELLSPKTMKEDLGRTERQSGQPPTKWEVYEQILQIPYYLVYSRYTNKLQMFNLVKGRYRQVGLLKNSLWLPELELGVGVWSGKFQGAAGNWLRWYDALHNWIPTPAEREQQRAEQERQRADRLAAQLRALGIKPED